MTYLEELWRSLFNKDITTLEQEVMLGVSEKFDRDDAVTLLAAITVRMLFLVLIEHKASPFRVLRNFAKAMEENRQKTALISETYERLQRDLSELRGDVNAAREALNEARDLARAKVGYHPLMRFIPDPGSETAAVFSLRSVALLMAGCFASGLLGCTIAFMMFLG